MRFRSVYAHLRSSDKDGKLLKNFTLSLGQKVRKEGSNKEAWGGELPKKQSGRTRVSFACPYKREVQSIFKKGPPQAC